MVGSTGTLMTMRLVRSKLRKREESSVSAVSVEASQEHQIHHQQLNNNIHHHHQLQQQQQQNQLNNNNSSSNNQQNGQIHIQIQPQQQQPAHQQVPAIAYRQNSVWVFPPLPPQPNLFCTSSQVSITIIIIYAPEKLYGKFLFVLNPAICFKRLSILVFNI